MFFFCFGDSDHIALLKAYEGWKDAKRYRNEKSFCWENFLSPVTMQMIEDMRYQFLDLLAGIGFVNKSQAKVSVHFSFFSERKFINLVIVIGRINYIHSFMLYVCRRTINTAMIWRWYVQYSVLDSTQMLCNAKEEESGQLSTPKKSGRLTFIQDPLMPVFTFSLFRIWCTVKK